MTAINVCFPSDPLSSRSVDPDYIEDARAFAQLGAGVLVWSMDEPHLKTREAKGFTWHEGAPAVWRGWMLDSEHYRRWSQSLGTLRPRYDLLDYEMHHRMRHWIPVVRPFTPEAWFIDSSHDVQDFMFPCHVKDGVKSANASYLPRPCWNHGDVVLHEQELKKQRGVLDDGLVVRRHMDVDGLETRVWVMGPAVDDIYCVAHESLRNWVAQVLANAPAAFFAAPFTMDVVQEKHTLQYRIMDMGDAGVSDYKEGHADPAFLGMLRSRWYRTWMEPERTVDYAWAENPTLSV